MAMLFILLKRNRIFTGVMFLGIMVSHMDVTGQSTYTGIRSLEPETILRDRVGCQITIPHGGYIFYDPDLMFIKAVVMDSQQVYKVDFYMDSLHLGTDYTPPFHNMKLFNAPMGSYDLIAEATYYDGTTATSPPVDIIIRCVREDLDSNGSVNINDFLILLGSYGLPCMKCTEDLTQDGVVNTLDYLRFLGNLGVDCN